MGTAQRISIFRRTATQPRVRYLCSCFKFTESHAAEVIDDLAIENPELIKKAKEGLSNHWDNEALDKLHQKCAPRGESFSCGGCANELHMLAKDRTPDIE